jgi:hypothetical protein
MRNCLGEDRVLRCGDFPSLPKTAKRLRRASKTLLGYRPYRSKNSDFDHLLVAAKVKAHHNTTEEGLPPPRTMVHRHLFPVDRTERTQPQRLRVDAVHVGGRASQSWSDLYLRQTAIRLVLPLALT